MLRLTGFLTMAALAVHAQVPVVSVDTPMPPPEWALLQREVLDANSRAVEEFAAKYMDRRGYLLRRR